MKRNDICSTSKATDNSEKTDGLRKNHRFKLDAY